MSPNVARIIVPATIGKTCSATLGDNRKTASVAVSRTTVLVVAGIWTTKPQGCL